MKGKSHAAFHWLSFLPALAYWWLEENYPLNVALLVGLGLAVVEVSLEKFFTGRVHTLSRLNFGILLVLGAFSLWAHEGVWFKLQPTFTGVICGGWLGMKSWRGSSLLEEAMYDMGQPWPHPREWLLSFERHICAFMLSYAGFMAYWAFWGTTSQWAFWKTGGQYLSFGLFMVIEFLWLRHRLKKSRG